jgi:hypothetical protein
MLIAVMQWYGGLDIPTFIAIGLFIIAFQSTIGSLIWPYLAEVSATESGYALSTLFLWICVLLITICSVYLMRALTTAGTFFFFSIFTLVGGFVFICFLKESKGVP